MEIKDLLIYMISQSKIIASALAVFIIYKSILPISNNLYHFIEELFSKEERKNFENKAKKKISHLRKNLPELLKASTFKFLGLIEKIYRFEKRPIDSNSHVIRLKKNGILSHFSFKTFPRTHLITYIYIFTSLLIIGWNSISEFSKWQLLIAPIYCLVCYFLFDRYKNNLPMILTFRFIVIIVILPVATGVFINRAGILGSEGTLVAAAGLVGGALGSAYCFPCVIVCYIIALFYVKSFMLFAGHLDLFSLVFFMFFFIFILLFLVDKLNQIFEENREKKSIKVLFPVLAIVLFVQAYFLVNKNISSEVISIFDYFQDFISVGVKERSYSYMLFFLVFTLMNTFIDWVSITVTRYMFHSLTLRKDVKLSHYMKVILIDLLLGIFFVFLMLLVLYISSNVFVNSGVAFKPELLRAYFRTIFPLYNDFNLVNIFSPETGIFSSQDSSLITLMLITSLLPSLIHLSFVLFNVLSRIVIVSLSTFMDLVLGGGKLFSFLLSVVVTFILFLIILFLMPNLNMA